jgi:small subunit ribosomal protein S8
MSLNDPLANALSAIMNGEKVAKSVCTIQPISSLIKKVLEIMNTHQYIGTYEETEDQKGNFLVVNLLGHINKCGVIKPRFAVTLDDFDKFEKRFLPARNIGIIIISTSQGLMTHNEAKKKEIGGKLIAYCY